VTLAAAVAVLGAVTLAAIGIDPGTSDAATAAPWVKMNEPGPGAVVTGLAISPFNGSHVVAGGELNSAVWSTDGGRSWGLSSGLVSTEIGEFTWSDPNTVWVGTYGGPAKSTDGGRTWSMMPTWPRSQAYDDRTDRNRRVEKVLVDPANPNHVLAFCGNQRQLSPYVPSDGDVYESNDGGANWTKLSNAYPSVINAAAASAGGVSTLYVATEGGLVRSENTGRSWSYVKSGPFRSVVAHPTDPRKAWAAGVGGVFVTTDAGFTWSLTGLNGSSYPGNTLGRMAVDIVDVSRTNPNILWASVGWYTSGSHAIFKSSDGGNSWESLNAYTRGYRSPFAPGGAANEFATALSIDPSNPNHVMGGNSEDILSTEDGGTTFWSAGSREVSPNRWVSRGFGAFFASWTGFSDTNASLMTLTGMDGANPLASNDAGASWFRPQAAVGNYEWGGSVQGDYSQDETLWALRGNSYSRGFGGVFRGGAGGAGAGEVIVGRGLPATDLFAQSEGSRSLAALNNGAIAVITGAVYRSVDNGASWSRSNPCTNASRVVRAHRSWTTLFLLCDQGVYRTDNAGASWSLMPGSPAGNGHNSGITSGQHGLVFYRWDSPTIRIFQNGVWRSSNVPAPGVGGAAIDSGNANVIVAGSYSPQLQGQTAGVGAFVSTDGGASWMSLSQGLSVPRFMSVIADPNRPGVFVGGTTGGGYYRVQLGTGGGGGSPTTTPPTTTPPTTIRPSTLATIPTSVPASTTPGSTTVVAVGSRRILNASASAAGTSATSMIDGNRVTAWRSASSQSSGLFVTLDIGSELNFDRVIVDAGDGGNPPASYTMYVSSSPNSWGTWKATGSGSGSTVGTLTTMRIPRSLGRYVTIQVKGSASSWSVAEMSVADGEGTGGFVPAEPTTTTPATNTTSILNAVDGGESGNTATIWASAIPQSSSPALRIDLGAPTAVTQIRVNAGNGNLSPSGYSVYLSTDATTWGPWVTGVTGQPQSQTLNIPIPGGGRTARYVTIQINAASASPWTVADVGVISGSGAPVPRNGWRVSTGGSFTSTNDQPTTPSTTSPVTTPATTTPATTVPPSSRSTWLVSSSGSAAGSSPASILDGNLSTFWTSSAAQDAVLYLRVDLGSQRNIDRVILDSGTTGRAGRDVTVYVSSDPNSWGAWKTRVQNSGGQARTTINIPRTFGRYVTLQVRGSATLPWSLAEFDVFDSIAGSPSAAASPDQPVDQLVEQQMEQQVDQPVDQSVIPVG
jgi:hypothetical protein